MTRRTFLQTLSAAPFLSRYHAIAAPDLNKVKIRDIQTMVVQGPRTYTLVKVVSDAGLYGIGEAYGSPGAGVKEQIHVLKSEIIGKDPARLREYYARHRWDKLVRRMIFGTDWPGVPGIAQNARAVAVSRR